MSSFGASLKGMRALANGWSCGIPVQLTTHENVTFPPGRLFYFEGGCDNCHEHWMTISTGAGARVD
jgi:hypothetical protein